MAHGVDKSKQKQFKKSLQGIVMGIVGTFITIFSLLITSFVPINNIKALTPELTNRISFVGNPPNFQELFTQQSIGQGQLGGSQYDQCKGLWGAPNFEGILTKSKGSGYQGEDPDGPWASLTSKAKSDLQMKIGKMAPESIQSIVSSNRSDLEAQGAEKEKIVKEEIWKYYVSLVGNWIIQGGHLYNRTFECRAVIDMTCDDTTAPQGGTYQPQSMGMMMMMGMGGMASGGMSTGMGMSGSMGVSGMPGTMGMSGMGAGGMGSSANPMMMMMMGGQTQCKSTGPETQDWTPCKKIIQFFDFFMLAQQSTQTFQQLQMTQSTLSAQREMLAATTSGTTTPTLQLELMQKQMQQAAEIAATRALLEITKSGAFIGLYRTMPTRNDLIGRCQERMRNASSGESRYLKYVTDIISTYKELLEQPNPFKTESIDLAVREVGGIPGQEQLLLDIQLTKNSVNCRSDAKEQGESIKNNLVLLENQIKDNKDRSNIQTYQKSLETIKEQIRNCSTPISPSGGFGGTTHSPIISKIIKFYQKGMAFLIGHTALAQSQQEETSTTPQGRATANLPQSIENAINGILQIRPSQDKDPSSFQQKSANDIKDMSNLIDAIKNELKNNLYDSSQGTKNYLCNHIYEPGYNPNQSVREFAKMLAMQAAIEGGTSAAKGYLAQKEAAEIEAIIERLKQRIAVNQTPIPESNEMIVEECKVNPTLPQCRGLAKSNPVDFGGLTNLDIKTGGEGTFVEGKNATSDSSGITGAGQKGSANPGELGSAVGAGLPEGSGKGSGGFDAPLPGAAKVNAKGTGDGGGGGSGGGGASAPRGPAAPGSNAPQGGKDGESKIVLPFSGRQPGQYEAKGIKGGGGDKSDNPFDKLFKKDGGANPSVMEFGEGIADKNSDLFKRISDRYIKVNSSDRLIKYDTVDVGEKIIKE